MSQFFFYKKIIEAVCTIFIVIIKDLEVYLDYSNLLFKKSAICLSFQFKKEKLINK